MQAGQENIEQAASPSPISRSPEPITILGQKLMRHLHAGQMSEQDAMGVERAFRLSGGTRCIDHHGRIVSGGVNGCEFRACNLNQCVEIQGIAVGPIGGNEEQFLLLAVPIVLIKVGGCYCPRFGQTDCICNERYRT